MQTDESIIRLSGDDIIELVRENRNDIIKKLVKGDSLTDFLSVTYQLNDISPVKIEFIRRALKDLVNSPLDLSHYGALILEIRKAGSMTITKNNEVLFFQDVEKAIRNYIL